MKKLLVILTIVFLGYITTASIIQESPFSSRGYTDLYINEAGAEKCKTYGFPADADGRNFGIISLHAGLAPVPRSSSKITVLFNTEKLAELGYTDMPGGLARIPVPRGLMAQSNELLVCGRTSSSGAPITVYADSEFGVYSGAYFPEGEGFRMDLETYAPIVGVPFEITATARNYGTEDINVSLSYRKAELERAAPEVSVLEGETSKRGTVPKCAQWNGGGCTEPGEFSISYFIVAHKAVPFTLLPSVMRFTNVFGEEQTMLTNRPDLGAVEPPHRISAKVALDNDKLYTGEGIPLTITVQNISGGTVQEVKVSPKTGLEVSGEAEKYTGALGPNQRQDIVFAVRGPEAGNYVVGCSAEYDSRTLECETTTVTLQRGLGAEIIATLLLTLISLAVFAYFYFKK